MKINDFLYGYGIAPQNDKRPGLEIDGEWFDTRADLWPDEQIWVETVGNQYIFRMLVVTDNDPEWRLKVVALDTTDVSVRMSREADYIVADIYAGSDLTMTFLFLS